MPKKVEFKTSSLLESVEFFPELEGLDLPPGTGVMVATFKRNGDKYAYYPMMELVYDIHSRNMKTEDVSAGVYFKKTIQNLFSSKKIS